MDLELDASGDLVIENGDLQLLTGREAVAQHLGIRYKFFQGEWFADTRVGMPYFQKILGKRSNLDVVRSLFRQATITTPGITSLESLDLSYEGTTRVLGIDVKARAADGEPLNFSTELIL